MIGYRWAAPMRLTPTGLPIYRYEYARFVPWVERLPIIGKYWTRAWLREVHRFGSGVDQFTATGKPRR